MSSGSVASPHLSVENGSDSGCNGDTGDKSAGMSDACIFFTLLECAYIFLCR